ASAVVVDEVDVGRVDSGFLREQCERQRVVTGGGDGDLLRVVLQRIDQRVEVVEVPVLGRHDHEVLDVEGGDERGVLGAVFAQVAGLHRLTGQGGDGDLVVLALLLLHHRGDPRAAGAAGFVLHRQRGGHDVLGL